MDGIIHHPARRPSDNIVGQAQVVVVVGISKQLYQFSIHWERDRDKISSGEWNLRQINTAAAAAILRVYSNSDSYVLLSFFPSFFLYSIFKRFSEAGDGGLLYTRKSRRITRGINVVLIPYNLLKTKMYFCYK